MQDRALLKEAQTGDLLVDRELAIEKRRRRSPAPGGRPLSVVVWLSEREMALIGGVAARECLAVSAWLGEAGVRAATQPVDTAALAGALRHGLGQLDDLDGARAVRQAADEAALLQGDD